jgi:hypothetical protein
LFLFVVVIVMATAAGGEAVPSKYYGECVLEARGNATASFMHILQACSPQGASPVSLKAPFRARPLQA